jgi:hypothetical protein
MAQKKSTINLIQSDRGMNVKINGLDVFKVYNGIFKQQYSTLRSDSAYVHVKDNTFDAFGHVVIIQGDSLHIYADTLHYNDNTKIAILVNNVRMVDKDAVLTTNNFTYNTATRYGTYINGGKLVNKDNVLTSVNGYYFAQSRDAYFRYNVRLTTPDALILTDTLRYNSGSRIAYFYGPTNIYGKKDKDTLYTENGTYNTKTEQAFFGKNNLYKQDTKSLKGDSLFYDRLKGYGKAIKNVTFTDREQKITLKGNLGECYKEDDRAVMTQNPYVIFVTEEQDSTKTDTDGNKAASPPGKADTVKQLTKDTIPAGSGAMMKGLPEVAITQAAASAQMAAPLGGALKDSLTSEQAKGHLPKTDSIAKIAAPMLAIAKDTIAKHLKTGNIKPPAAVTAIKGKAAKPGAKSTTVKANTNKTDQGAVKNIQPVKQLTTVTASDTSTTAAPIPLKDTVAKSRPDTMYIGADTLETRMLAYRELKDLQEKRRLAGIRDTSAKFGIPFEPYKTIPKELVLDTLRLVPDTPSYINRPLFDPKPVPADTLKETVSDSTKNAKGTGKNKRVVIARPKSAIESLMEEMPVPDLADTARVRILSAHHHVKIFKSDLQGKADSLFYSSADSVIRNFVNPIYWAQGSQLTGDTIYMQLKNKKLYKMDVFTSAFMVNTEKQDTAHFNQVKGRKIRGYFKDSKIDRVIDYGNAEAIYWKRDSDKVSGMAHSLSSSIDAHFKKGEITRVSSNIKHDGTYFPLLKVKEDDKILKGFIWKPNERPASKEDVIHPKKPVLTPAAPAKTTGDKFPAKGKAVKSTKAPAKNTSTGKTSGALKSAAKDSVANPGNQPAGQLVSKDKDTVGIPPIKPGTAVRDSIKTKADTLKKAPAMPKDSIEKE